MPTPWYQFSLRSLLLLTLFVAMLCSIGVCTHWVISAAVAMLALGGIAGRTVAGTRWGFAMGVWFAFYFVLLTCFGLATLMREETWNTVSWLWFAVVGIASLIGGILGGFAVRPRSEE